MRIKTREELDDERSDLMYEAGISPRWASSSFRCCDGLCGGSDCERCHPEGEDEESEDEE